MLQIGVPSPIAGFPVVGWRGNDLAAVSPPPGDEFTDGDSWALGTTESSTRWVTCPSGGTITLNTQIWPISEGIPNPNGGVVKVDQLKFAGGGWSSTGSTSYPKTDVDYNFDDHTQSFQCKDQMQR